MQVERSEILKDHTYWANVLESFRQTPTGMWLGSVHLEEEGEDTNVVDLSIVRSATDGTIPPISDIWLLNLKPGSEFLVEDKIDRTNFMQLRFVLIDVNKKTGQLYLFNKDLSDTQPFGEISPRRFTNRFELIEVIDPKEETENE